MSRHIRFISLFLLATCASSVLSSSQVSSSSIDEQIGSPATSPIAYVYVSSSVGSGIYEVMAYTASSTGELTPISGSPFPANVQQLAASKNLVFGTNGIDINSFAVASDGALTQVGTLNARSLNQNDCGGPLSLFLDNTGTTLYDPDLLGDVCANNAYQSFSVDAATGALGYLGSAVASPAVISPLTFIANNTFGYTSACYRYMPSIFGYQRNRDQTLTQVSLNPPIPSAASGDYYCPTLAAADNSNHVVIPFMPLTYSWQSAGPVQLAVYTAGSSGNLITKSTASNMPKTGFTSVTDIRASPSGKYVAVAGTTGLQIFRLNGADPITHFTPVLVSHPVDHIFWDNANHLYAISNATGKLYIYSVSASVTAAPHSPYAITNPQSIVVLPKT